MQTILTTHARVRVQQRGIRRDVLDYLVAYGHREFDHKHCEIVVFDHKAIDRIKKEEGEAAAHLACDHRNVFAVVADESTVVTTGHRYRRVMRNRSQASLRPRRRRGKRRPVF